MCDYVCVCEVGGGGEVVHRGLEGTRGRESVLGLKGITFGCHITQ